MASPILLRPSHPSPNTAMSRGHYDWVHAKVQRPPLRIITNAPVGIKRPQPIRNAGVMKSAPLYLPPNVQLHDPAPKVVDWLNDPEEVDDHEDEFGDKPGRLVVRVDPPAKAPQSQPFKQGHKRRLSDKFKNLFSALHLKKDDRIPILRPENLVFQPQTANLNPSEDENEVRRWIPTRPHRSPGTASFLVTRHLAPNPEMPESAHPSCSSSSTTLSTASRPTWAESQRLYLAPPTYDVSHFSNPTTLSSATTTGRSVSSSVVERSPGEISSRMGLHEGVRLGARVRRVASLPEMRSPRMM